MQYRIKIWDWPLRLFHWSMVMVVSAAIGTGMVGGNAMQYHELLGITLSGLLGFRLAWGVVGTRTARFVHFVRGPHSIIAYLQGRWQGIGHNPLGALSVIALLALFGFQAVSGLFANDDIAFKGPLNKLVDAAVSDFLTGLHQNMLWWMVGLIGLHLVAVAYYHWIKKDELLQPMIRGWKWSASVLPENSAVNLIALLFALGVGVLCAVGASGIWLAAPELAPVSTTPDW